MTYLSYFEKFMLKQSDTVASFFQICIFILVNLVTNDTASLFIKHIISNKNNSMSNETENAGKSKKYAKPRN